MKRKNLDKMINLIDDGILEEASPIKSKKSSLSKFGWIQIAIAAACLILTLNTVIMIPLLIGKGGNDGDGSTPVVDGGSDTENDVMVLPEFNDDKKPMGGSDSSSDKGNESTSTDSSDKESDTTDTSTSTETESEKPQNVTNIQINVPGKTPNIITLTSPLLSAPSEYDKIVASMQSFIGGTKNDELGEDIKDEIEDAMDKAEQDQESKEEYKETTDNQIDGIIEGDLIKRSNEYIYYLSGSILKIYTMNGVGSSLLNQFSIRDYLKEIDKVLTVEIENEGIYDRVEEIIDSSSQVKEMFLSTDCKTITVIAEQDSYVTLKGNKWMSRRSVPYTSLISISVEDPTNVYLKDITTVCGAYESARLIDGEFLVFTRYAPVSKELIIPQYNDGEGFTYIPLENIYSPDKYRSASYLLAFTIDGDTSKVLNSGAFASFNGEIYVTNENIYVTRRYRGEEKLNIENYPLYKKGSKEIIGYGTKYDVYSMEKTDILRIAYSKNGFMPVGVVTVNGYIKDRYSLSENEGYLYVVTTDERVLSKTVYDEGDIGMEEEWIGYRNTTSASIFIVNKETMEKMNALERFAPTGDIVRSVRFDGYKAYVCTAFQKQYVIIDPVYFFDLTDPQNIVSSDTGTIPGMSVNLIELPNGELIGIGTDGEGNLKIESYRLGENDEVIIVDTFLVKASSYSTDYKAHYVDRENGLIGVGFVDRDQFDSERYIMLQYKDGYFKEVFNCTLRGTSNSKRVVYENGYFYLFSDKDFTVYYSKIK